MPAGGVRGGGGGGSYSCVLRRCRANMAHRRQPTLNSGLGFQKKVLRKRHARRWCSEWWRWRQASRPATPARYYPCRCKAKLKTRYYPAECRRNPRDVTPARCPPLPIYYGEHGVAGFVGEGGERACTSFTSRQACSTNSCCWRGGGAQSARGGGGVRCPGGGRRQGALPPRGLARAAFELGQYQPFLG